MSEPLPIETVEAALHGPRKGRPPLSLELATKLDASTLTHTLDALSHAAKQAARLAHGSDDDAIVREVVVSLAELSPLAQTFVVRMTAVLSNDRESSKEVRAELLRLSARLANALAASVPPATLVDVTLFDAAARTAHAFDGETDLRGPPHEMMLRLFAARLGVDLVFGGVVETAAQAAERLVELDPVARRAERRALDITHAIRATLPEP